MRDAEDPQVRLTVRGDLLCESSYGRFWQRQPWRRQKDRWLPGAGEEGSVKRQNTGFRAGKRLCGAARWVHAKHGEGITRRGALVPSAGSACRPRVGAACRCGRRW